MGGTTRHCPGGIASFYAGVFNFKPQLSSDGKECLIPFEVSVDVNLGGQVSRHQQVLIFRETPDAKPRDHYAQHDAAKYVALFIIFSATKLCFVCVWHCAVSCHRTPLHFALRYSAQNLNVHRYHLAIYLPTTEAYEASFLRAQARNLLYFNPAFKNVAPQFSSSMTREEAMKYRQFRVKDIYAEPTTSARSSPGRERELLLMLEHEVRGPLHVANPRLRV